MQLRTHAQTSPTLTAVTLSEGSSDGHAFAHLARELGVSRARAARRARALLLLCGWWCGVVVWWCVRCGAVWCGVVCSAAWQHAFVCACVRGAKPRLLDGRTDLMPADHPNIDGLIRSPWNKTLPADHPAIDVWVQFQPQPLGTPYRCVVWRGVAGRGWAWRGVAWRGVAWLGVAWRGCAWRGYAGPGPGPWRSGA